VGGSTFGEGVVEGEDEAQDVGEAEEVRLYLPQFHLLLVADDSLAFLLQQFLAYRIPAADDDGVE
jgi:hypothetical protein